LFFVHLVDEDASESIARIVQSLARLGIERRGLPARPADPVFREKVIDPRRADCLPPTAICGK